MKSIQKSTDRLRRKEIATLARSRKAHATAALKQLTALRKQADKIVAAHRQTDAILARRSAIVESRLA